ncbi:MAG: lactate utilization protein C [bacterium]
MTADHYSLFKQNYEKLAGCVYLAESLDQAVEHVGDIISSSECSTAVLAPLPENLETKVQRRLSRMNVGTVAIDDHLPGIAHAINQADVGISTAAFAIAFTGTIVEVTTEDSHRLVSTLPRVHIAFVPAAHIVPSLAETAPRIREIHKQHPRYCNLTFISGPSRTADIEMKLFLGVHGPRESHVIVCAWESRHP